MPRYGHGFEGHCGCHYEEAGSERPMNKDEMVEELEDYKASLESEIVGLEHRIKTLKEKSE